MWNTVENVFDISRGTQSSRGEKNVCLSSQLKKMNIQDAEFYWLVFINTVLEIQLFIVTVYQQYSIAHTLYYVCSFNLCF